MSEAYYIATFHTNSDVMQAETLIGKNFSVTVMPIPQEISAGCGLALRIFNFDEERSLLAYLSSIHISGYLHKMGNKKEQGHYPVETILSFPSNDSINDE